MNFNVVYWYFYKELMFVLQKYGGEGIIGGGIQRMVVDQMKDLERQNEELIIEFRDIQSEFNKEKRVVENVRQRGYYRLFSGQNVYKNYFNSINES